MDFLFSFFCFRYFLFSTSVVITLEAGDMLRIPESRQRLILFMVLWLDIETDLWLFNFVFTVTVHRLQSVFLYYNLLLLLYCIPLTWQISISIPLLFLCMITYAFIVLFSSVYCIAITLFSSASTVVSLLLCLFSLCLLHCRSHSTLLLC